MIPVCRARKTMLLAAGSGFLFEAFFAAAVPKKNGEPVKRLSGSPTCEVNTIYYCAHSVNHRAARC